MTCTTTITPEFDAEDVVQVLSAFRDNAGDFIIPPAVTFRVTSPVGDATELVYLTDGAVENGTFTDSAGTTYNFRASVQPIELEPTNPAGLWPYKWIATDDATPVEDRIAGSEAGAFIIRRP